MTLAEAILLTITTAAQPLLLAAIGELVVERSGVLNLGVEGMIVMGAVVAFAAAQLTGSAYLGALFGMAAGCLFSLLFAFLTLTLVANQVATGLALTILGLGLSGMIGESFVGQRGVQLEEIAIPVLSSIPLIGNLLFNQDLIFYISIFSVFGVSWFLFKTRLGLQLRAIGDSHGSAHALGISVIKTRYLAVMFGGACAGLAGAQLSLVYTPQWVENMSADGSHVRWWSLPVGVRCGFWLVPICLVLSPLANCMLRRLVSGYPPSSCLRFPIWQRSLFLLSYRVTDV
mgnify:CR=1 FL=1